MQRPANHPGHCGARLVGDAREADGVDAVVVQAPVAEEAEVPRGEEVALDGVEEEGAQEAGGGGEEDRAGAARGGRGEGLLIDRLID